MRYFIIAGEQSGDLHGSNLVRGLLKADHNAQIYCWGGDLMQTAGATLLMHYSKTAFMGFMVILKNLKVIKRNLSLCKNQIKETNPDVLILIDYPGFNLRIAEYAKKNGFRIYYYISPKFWAWKEKRVEKIKKYVDRMYIIFPFEMEFYIKHDIPVKFYGNPLVDEIGEKISSAGNNIRDFITSGIGDKPVIAILAGSRRHEVKHILPGMLNIVHHFPEYQFVVAGVKNLPDELYIKIIGDKPVMLIKEKTYEILSSAQAALVASGTATLETALVGIPQVVCYKGDFLSALIAWTLIKVRYISLVNLIMDKEVVKELLQYAINEKNLLYELKAILPGGSKREQILADYEALREKLGPAGASDRIAAEMVGRLEMEKK